MSWASCSRRKTMRRARPPPAKRWRVASRRLSAVAAAPRRSPARWRTPGGSTDQAFQTVERVLGSVVRHRGRLTAFGLPLFLWFSTRLFGGLRAALNEVFDTDERRPWPVAKLLDLAMVLGTGALLVVSGLVAAWEAGRAPVPSTMADRKSTRLNSSHGYISYAVFCLKKKKQGIPYPAYVVWVR